MIKTLSTITLSKQLATVPGVIHLKSSLPPMLFAGIGGFKARIAQQTKPTAKNNLKNKSVITLYAYNIFTKRTHQQRDTYDEHDTKSCCCNTNSADVRNGWDRCGKGRVEDFGRDVLVCNRLAEYIQRCCSVSDGTEEHKEKMEEAWINAMAKNGFTGQFNFLTGKDATAPFLTTPMGGDKQ